MCAIGQPSYNSTGPDALRDGNSLEYPRMARRSSMLSSVRNSEQSGSSFSQSRPYTSYQPPSSFISRAESPYTQEDSPGSDFQFEESEEQLCLKIMRLKVQLAEKKKELDQLSANVKSDQRKRMDGKRTGSVPQSPSTPRKEQWRRTSMRLESELALKNLEVDKLTAALKSSSNVQNSPAKRVHSMPQSPRMSKTNQPYPSPAGHLNQPQLSSWKDWGTDPYSRTFSVGDLSHHPTTASPTIRSTVTSLFGRLPSGSTISDDTIYSDSEAG